MYYYKDNPNIIVFDHPLLKQKITLMRDENTATN